MIPDYNDNGYLPPTIHRATLEETGRTFVTDRNMVPKGMVEIVP
jgi:hypothetical protein